MTDKLSADDAARLSQLEAERSLNEATDRLLEDAIRDRLPLDKALGPALPILAEHAGATSVWVRTYDEGLELTDFIWEPEEEFPRPLDTLFKRVNDSGRYVKLYANRTVVAQILDVAGESVGVAAMCLPGRREDPQDQEALSGLLDVWSEEVDNFLAAIALARHKHRVTRAISEALKEPVLDDGIDEAIRIIYEQIHFKEMLLVFRHEDDAEGTTLHYKIVRDGVIEHDSSDPGDKVIHGLMEAEAVRLIIGQPTVLLDRLGIESFREEALINGVRQRQIIGRIIVTSPHGEFSTFDRDLLERFAENIRLRIVDFNRQWKRLSLCFSPGVVTRILRQDQYEKTVLAPQEAKAAALFVDISGFTRISEKIGQPALIARLIDSWAAEVVDVLWATDGVFDKMVGDCIIGLWGPPFFDRSPAEICRHAAQAALLIRDQTMRLVESAGLDFVQEPLTVAAGLNYTSMVVGYFGPDENYTGFSSGMNNTARLQGLASPGEILCHEDFVRTLGQRDCFGPPRSSAAKNVADPLEHRALLHKPD